MRKSNIWCCKGVIRRRYTIVLAIWWVVIFIFCTGFKSPRDTVYYRIYTEDGEIASIDAQVPRLLSISVSPPHNVDSLKRAICATERIRDCSRTSLFLSPSSKAPMTDEGRISILTSGGPGSIPEEPVAPTSLIAFGRQYRTPT
jgi:hypothetical protein